MARKGEMMGMNDQNSAMFAALVKQWERIIRKSEDGQPLTAMERAMLFNRDSTTAQAELTASRYGSCFND